MRTTFVKGVESNAKDLYLKLRIYSASEARPAGPYTQIAN